MVGRCRNFFVTRLLRFWEACNVKKGGELMGIDLVLLDRKRSENVSHVTLYLFVVNSDPWHCKLQFDSLRRQSSMNSSYLQRETERVRPQEDIIIDSVRTESLCAQLPTAGFRHHILCIRGSRYYLWRTFGERYWYMRLNF
ncbi:unnamed protein product [Brassica oleracea var. botrytis]|nr:unnamed protein product [Brassica napus]CDY62082.1 BnaC01g42850D [Brassica napus]VDD51001.1 unnamed protein product [Brassica oleracea]